MSYSVLYHLLKMQVQYVYVLNCRTDGLKNRENEIVFVTHVLINKPVFIWLLTSPPHLKYVL